jgi:general secretion pathway protein A
MMSRGLNLPVSFQKADLIDQIHQMLGQFEEQENRHPVLILDNCENLSVDVLEHLRLMTSHDMESEDRFSIILIGTEKLLDTINNPASLSFKQRINFIHHLTGFSVNDAKAYVQYHLSHAEGPSDLFDDEAIQLIFQVSRGYPRLINQVGTHALIRAAIKEKERITKSFLQNQVLKQAIFIHPSPSNVD